ncbi:MAG TPA: RidA family protein [Microthrixaceae bacterium]|nr:RidA family protein [Microthrixaceae bacterium]
MTTTHINPDTLTKNPAFTQVVVAENPTATIYVGGQNGVTAEGKLAGETLYEQSKQTFANLEAALHAAGASLEDVVKWNVSVLDGHPIEDGLRAFGEAWGDRPNPPAISVLVVHAFANPDYLVEIDAIAVI